MTAPVTWTPTAQAVLARLRGRLFATVPEASVILDYDRQGRTLRAAIAAGDVPSVKVGSTYRIPVAWLRMAAGLPPELPTATGDAA
jgi:hypothetical protein